jgi:hypothetical protein
LINIYFSKKLIIFKKPVKKKFTMKLKLIFSLFLFPVAAFSQPIAEKNGMVTVEAEQFISQEKDEIRKWYIIDAHTALLYKGVDAGQCENAGGNAFIAVLPDTRITHDDKLIQGQNFTNKPGEMAIVSYRIHFTNPGKYYVWARAFSTGSEDNGLHVGLNGHWPDSGQRMQWCEGKNQWSWASKQRTEAVHCGEEGLIYLEIPSSGEHTISFSMREDGFRFDKFVLSMTYSAPE